MNIVLEQFCEQTGMDKYIIERLHTEVVDNSKVKLVLNNSSICYSVIECRVVDYIGESKDIETLCMMIGDLSFSNLYNCTMFKMVNKNKLINNEIKTNISCVLKVNEYKSTLRLYSGEIPLDTIIFANNNCSIESEYIKIELEDSILFLTFDNIVSDKIIAKIGRILNVFEG